MRDKGFAVTPEEVGLLEQKVMHELKPGDMAIFAGSLCAGLDSRFFGTLLDKCVAAGARVVVDSSGDPLLAAKAHHVWLLKPNLEEFRQLVGAEVPNRLIRGTGRGGAVIEEHSKHSGDARTDGSGANYPRRFV